MALTTAELGARLGLSADTIRREIEAGEIVAARTRGGHYRIPLAEADRYVRRMAPEMPQAPQERTTP